MTSPTNQSTTLITNLSAPPYNTQWIDSNGYPTRTFRSFMDLVYQRIGGASGDVIYTASDFSNADAAAANQIYAAFQNSLDSTNQIVFSINEQTQDTVQPWIDDIRIQEQIQPWIDDSPIPLITQTILDTPAAQIIVTPTLANSKFYPVLASADNGPILPNTSDSLYYNPNKESFTIKSDIANLVFGFSEDTVLARQQAGVFDFSNAGLQTGAIVLPVGTTGQEPTAVAGMIRYNSTTSAIEYYNGAWITSGTVTGVSIVTANGISGTVANHTTTPAITLSLGAITPSSVAVTGAFGCNGATPQTAYASGGAVATTTPTLGAYGFTLAQAEAIITLLNNIQAGQVASGQAT